MKSVVSALVSNIREGQKYPVVQVLEKFGDNLLGHMVDCGITICVLAPGAKYRDHSLAISQQFSQIDSWPHPPAGLFSLEERTVYLRSLSTMTIAHELGHALDCALGNGAYWSGQHSQILHAFASARNWVTPYAATRIDEYFAESVRAYLTCNDATSPWPAVSRAKLKAIDLAMYTILEELFTSDHA